MDPFQPGSNYASLFIRTTLLLVCLAVYHRTGKAVFQLRRSANLPVAGRAESKSKPPVKKKKKKIFLTFDDGPNHGTPKVLHIMQEEAVPVSFFIVGEHVFASSGQQQIWDSLKMAQQIELCNHSFSHANNRYADYYSRPDSVVSDFKRSQDSLQLDNNICRTPGRNTWRIDTLQFTDLSKSKAAVDSLQKAGFAIMGWDLEWHFNPKDMSLANTADDLLRQIDSVFAQHRTRVPEHLVLLAHDQVYTDANDSIELHNFIRLLKLRDDYELELVSNYPGIKN
ncbi:MAG: polysaccharide deacetylase family protein [Bacteroidota bacterium]|nr:polysaccharide deacetylase family protein [Bacteroidota bacterium]